MQQIFCKRVGGKTYYRMTQVNQEGIFCLVWDCGFSTLCITHEVTVSQIQVTSPLHHNEQP